MLEDRLFEYDESFDVELPKKLAKIWMETDIEKALRPTNYTELEKCFVETGEFFNPQFNYDYRVLKDYCSNLDVLSQGLSNVLVNIEPLGNEDQSRAIFIEHLITVRLNEMRSYCKFLQKVIEGCPEKAFSELLVIYDLPDSEVVKFAKEIAAKGWDNVYDDIDKYTVINTLKKRKRMQTELFSAQTVAQSFRTALLHLLKEPIMCRYFNDTGVFEARLGAYEKIGTVFEDGRMVVGIPEECFVNGEDLLALIANEVDGHFRSFAVTRTFVSTMLGKGSPLAPLASILAKSYDETNYQGLARNSYVYVKGLAGLPEPFSVLAADYARHKHNFAETAKYIYNRCTTYGLDEAAARTKTWEVVTRVFLGQCNTGKHTGCVFLKDCGELAGFLRTGTITEEEYYYMRNLAAFETGELPCACIGGWLEDFDFADEIDCNVDVIDYMVDFF